MLRTNSSSLQPDRHLVLPSPSAGPPLGRSSADCAELSLIVSGSRDLPRGRRPQTEAVCRLLESQRKWGERWESTGRKATCRPVMQAERGCHRRGERDTWWARGNDVCRLGGKFLSYCRHQIWGCCNHLCVCVQKSLWVSPNSRTRGRHPQWHWRIVHYYIPTALCKYPFEEQARASHQSHISEKHFNPPICVKYYTNNKQLHESENWTCALFKKTFHCAI